MSDYTKTLNVVDKKRYVEKLCKLGFTNMDMDDPYLPDSCSASDKNLKKLKQTERWIDNVTAWPNVEFGSIYVYLIDCPGPFTRESMQAYRSLEAYNYYVSGWVQTCLYRKNDFGNCIIKAKVARSQAVNEKPHYAWVGIRQKDGSIESGHCTCMAGLGEVCSHVAAILFKVEAASRLEYNNVACTSLPCQWNQTFVKKVIQHQTVKYEIKPLSPLSKHRLSMLKRKTLVLDLDETLIHSHHDGVIRQTVKPGTPPDFVLKVVIDRHPVRFFVHKRPHVDFFLEVVSRWYDLVVFTASMEIYGAAVADKLDNNRGILNKRYYRQHCNLDFGSYTKDLSAISDDLSCIFILDNSPVAYRAYQDNAIPIKSWFSDATDTSLLCLLPLLDALRFCIDVRSVLSRNLHLHRLWQ